MQTDMQDARTLTRKEKQEILEQIPTRRLLTAFRRTRWERDPAFQVAHIAGFVHIPRIMVREELNRREHVVTDKKGKVAIRRAAQQQGSRPGRRRSCRL